MDFLICTSILFIVCMHLVRLILTFGMFQARASNVAWPTIPLKEELDGNCIEFRKVKRNEC